jgi:hypothetical protein
MIGRIFTKRHEDFVAKSDPKAAVKFMEFHECPATKVEAFSARMPGLISFIIAL